MLGLLVCLAGMPALASIDSIQFRDITPETGLGGPLAGMMGHAAAWGDIDGDGDQDLFVGGFADRPDKEYLPAQSPVSNRLFRNLGNGHFEPISNPALEHHGRTTAAVFVDLDNDGRLDLYVANNSKASSGLGPGVQHDAQLRRSELFRNDRGTLVDVSTTSGACLTAAGAARGIGVLDQDGDGRLDILVLEDRFGRNPRSRLCRNMGNFAFVDATQAAGLPVDLFGLGLAIADLNEDARPDIFVSHSNRLFLSTGTGKYVEPDGPKAALAWKPLDAEDWPAGAVFADLNRDGRQDLVVGIHHQNARNRVYLNVGLTDGVPRFRDVSTEVGLPVRLSTKSPHVEVQDFDNDGWPDLYFSAAWMDAGGAMTPLVFRHTSMQRGVPTFEPLRPLSSDAPNFYFPAGPSGDADGDGRIDLLLVNWFGGNHSRLLRNVSSDRRWLDVSVRGRTVNRMGVGTSVRVYKAGELDRDGGLLGARDISIGNGFGSGQPPSVHFGLGIEASVDLAITFPGGSRKVLTNVASDQRLIVEGP
jgi:hypothetical protein